MSVNFIFYVILFIIISVLKGSKLNKNEDDSFKLNINSNQNDASNKRKLQSGFEPIRIKTIYLSAFNRLVDPNDFKLVNESIYKAVNYIEELVKVRRLTGSITIAQSDNQGDLLTSYVGTTHTNTDLIIFFNANYKTAYDGDISIISILRKLNDVNNPNNGRPIITLLDYNLRFLEVYLRGAGDNKGKLLINRFMHEIFHFLGFEKSILSAKRLYSSTTKRRVKTSNGRTKYIATGATMMGKAREYFNCNFPGLEFEADEQFLHWDSRLLLGDIMTSNIYYPDQVISEFTLALLEDIGWYRVNYYTGGLMRYGKHMGCQFINDDCVKLNSRNEISPSFLNEFCFEENTGVYGTCSPGRQSKGYCLQKTIYSIVESDMRRKFSSIEWTTAYGPKNTEYCPITSEMLEDQEITDTSTNLRYFQGNCKIGNSNYGDEMEPSIDYNRYSQDFGEILGDNSLCGLSSIFTKTKMNNYDGNLRPTCYIMICSEKSLTVQIGNEEYIVCPRAGGLIKIGKNTVGETKYTNYYGYFFCPDYNLICAGTTFCNDIFDCIDKKSEYKTPNYDYQINNNEISSETSQVSQVTSNIKSNTELNQMIPVEGYELSDDGTCPINCRHCNPNKRCLQCRDSYPYYIGEKNDVSYHINCTNKIPEAGYYHTTINDNSHYFRCLENCKKCSNPDICEQCFPEFLLTGGNKVCQVRIENCEKYDQGSESAIQNDPLNGFGLGYQYCKDCKKDYYCVDGKRNECNYVSTTERERYYVMDISSTVCIQDCDVKYTHCIKCDINECFHCAPEFYFSGTNICSERIPHCIEYDTDTEFIDTARNKGGKGYRDCKTCDTNYYCIRNNRQSCEYISQTDLKGYYDYDDRCKDSCASIFTFVCLACTKERCTECQTKLKSDNIHCVDGIENCIKYNSSSATDDYIECSQCDKKNGYYCIDDIRTSCEKVENTSLYYSITDDTSDDLPYSCLSRCDSKFPGCETCTRDICLSCKKRFIMDTTGPEPECLIDFDRMPNDNCRISTHIFNLAIDNIDFYDLVDFYFEYTFSYLNTIDHFVNDKYTLAMFINSGCTEGLLEQGYYKIDSTELTNLMTKEASIRANEFLIHFFIKYNNHNYYRIHSIYTNYINPDKYPASLKTPFILTNKYNSSISSILGPILSSVVVSEKIDIFSKDSDIYTNLCQNITLLLIDIPLDERLHYLYLNDLSTQIACSGDNCELQEINKDEATSTCRCYLNKFEDLFKEIEFKNYEDQGISSSFAESFGIIKCAKNGFNSHNIKANGGFYISLIAIIGDGVLYICYLLCSSKTINLANPPSKIKHRLKIRTDWENANDKNKKKKPVDELICDFQDRDEREKDLYEEEKDYTCGTDSFFNDVNMQIFGKPADKIDSEKKKSKKFLVLLPGKHEKEGEESMSDESILLGKSKKKDKRSYCEIYWHVLSLKQHIINFFTVCNCCNITESYVPLPIRLIRSIFLVILAFLFNILFLNQKYYSQKFRYFNENYKLIAGTTDDVTITPEEVVLTKIPGNDIWKYSFAHTFVNALIVLALLIVVQFIIGVAFFSLRKYLFKRDDKSAITELESKTKIKYFIFFIITIVLLIVFMFAFIGFGGAYGGGFSDYFISGIISLIFLQIFPFIWSIIIALFYYIGIRGNSKCCRKVSRFFMF